MLPFQHLINTIKLVIGNQQTYSGFSCTLLYHISSVFMWIEVFICELLLSSLQVLRKLSYAEVCQKLAKDKPQMTTPSPPASTASQPLQELKVNGKEDSKNPGMRRSAEKPEKNGDGRHPRQPLRSFRGGNRQIGAGEPGPKFRENYRDTKGGKQFIPQRGSRRSGKEQNIPPTSQK